MRDAIVLGIGGVGVFALRALARRGARVLGLERFRLGHDRGSSHGGTRVFRHAYFEHADYVPLLVHATAEFRALGDALGRSLFEDCGTLLVGPLGCPVLAASEASARTHAIDVEALDAEAVRVRFPLFALPADHRGLFEPGGGFVRPEEALRCAAEDARLHGAELREGVRALHIEEDADAVRVVTAGGEPLRARRLLVCGGAWAAKLLPALAPKLSVTLQVQAWMRPPDAALARPDRLPAWFVVRGDAPPFYGLPADPLAADPLPKVALHGRDEPADPDAPRREIEPADEEELRAVLRSWLPALDVAPVRATTCLYTSTPDGHCVLGRAPGFARVVCAAGLSGHGFELTPALGNALADLALDGGTALPVGFLGIERFAERDYSSSSSGGTK